MFKLSFWENVMYHKISYPDWGSNTIFWGFRSASSLTKVLMFLPSTVATLIALVRIEFSTQYKLLDIQSTAILSGLPSVETLNKSI